MVMSCLFLIYAIFSYSVKSIIPLTMLSLAISFIRKYYIHIRGTQLRGKELREPRGVRMILPPNCPTPREVARTALVLQHYHNISTLQDDSNTGRTIYVSRGIPSTQGSGGTRGEEGRGEGWL